MYTFEEAQEKVREFYNSEARALTPMVGEMVILYDDRLYGPEKFGENPPNVELITKEESIYNTVTDDGLLTFNQILDMYDVELLEEVDLIDTKSEAKSKAFVGIPLHKIE